MQEIHRYKQYLDECREKGIRPKAPNGRYMSDKEAKFNMIMMEVVLGGMVILVLGIGIWVMLGT